jgi:choline dehydrogenase
MLHHGAEAYLLDQIAPEVQPPLRSDQGFCVSPNVTRPRSRGVVRLHSADPRLPPLIDPRYFTDEAGYDESTLLHGVGIARALAQTEPLSDWVASEVVPGAKNDGPEFAEMIRHQSGTVFHPAGTARMGQSTDADAVVDPELRVRGLSGLRIADASIFPVMVGVNIAVTCMLIGEQCARFIQGQAI